MDETIARAELPNLDIEIMHRRLPDEQAEYLAISLRATPSFGAVARVLEAGGPPTWPWLAMAPFAVWTRMMQAAWAPWLAVGPRPLEGTRGEILPAPDREGPPEA